MKNRYAILHNQALQRYIDGELSGDGVLIARTGYIGTQLFPFARAGDNRADFSFAAGALVRRAVGATPVTIVLPRLQEERTVSWAERPASP